MLVEIALLPCGLQPSYVYGHMHMHTRYAYANLLCASSSSNTYILYITPIPALLSIGGGGGPLENGRNGLSVSSPVVMICRSEAVGEWGTVGFR